MRPNPVTVSLAVGLLTCLPAVLIAQEETRAAQDNEVAPVPLSAADVAERFGPSVVLIKAELVNGEVGFGSGFFVAPDGVIATSLHLLEEARSLQVRIGGERFEVSGVRAFDIERDLAVVQIEADDLEFVVPGDTTTLRPGDPIFVISNPLGLVGTVSEGIVSAWREPSAEEADEAEEADDLDLMAQLQGLPRGRLLQMSTPASPGSSGGPVFDNHGYVIGVVCGGLAGGALGLNFAVPIEGLVPLLEVEGGWDLRSLRETLDRRRQSLAKPFLVDARYYLESGRLEEASRSLDRALGVFPRSGEALVLKGELLVQTGHTEEARQLFLAATEASPDSAEVWEKLGIYLLNHQPGRSGSFRVGEITPLTKRLAQATAAFEKALELDPWRAESAFGLGLAFVERGLLDNAREMLERAVDVDSDHIEAMLMLGSVCMVLDDVRSAERAFENALWLDRDHPQAHLGLSVVYERKGDMPRSSEHWQRYQELQQEEPQ